MGGVVGDEGDVEQDDAGVDGEPDALPLRQVLRARRGDPGQQQRRGGGGDGRGGGVGNEAAAGRGGGVGLARAGDEDASPAAGGEEEVERGGGGGHGGNGELRCCCLWLGLPRASCPLSNFSSPRTAACVYVAKPYALLSQLCYLFILCLDAMYLL